MSLGFFRRLWVEVTSFFEAEETGEEEINLRTLSIIFLLGLLLLFGTYFLFYDESITVYNLPLNVYHKSIGVYNKAVGSYWGTINSIRSSAIGETKIIGGSYKTIGCKDCKISAEFKKEQDEQILIVDYELSHRNYLWRQIHKVFERIFKIPVDFGWVQINKGLDHVDWSDYEMISIMVKGEGESSNLEFSILEEDGDAWYYFDEKSLASEDWIEIKMPFENFVNPKWASHGDGKKDFKGIIEIKLTIMNFEKSIKNKLYLETFDGEIFKLI